MDKVPYVLIGMMAGSIITIFVMALLFVAKREDESLERLFKAKKSGKLKLLTTSTAESLRSQLMYQTGYQKMVHQKSPKRLLRMLPAQIA